MTIHIPIIPDWDYGPCGPLKVPPFVGAVTPAYLACKQGSSAAGKVDDLAAKDDTTTVSALVAKYWGPNEKTREGDPAQGVARGLIYAESGGDPKVVNPAPCSADGKNHAVGWLQICCPMNMATEDAKDPDKNLAEARKLYDAAGKSFAKDWPTYGNGAWKGHTNFDKTVTVSKNSLTGAVGNVVDSALGPVDEFISSLLSASTYMRVGKGALGGVLIVVGVVTMAGIAIKASGALGVTPVGRTVTLAQRIGRPSS